MTRDELIATLRRALDAGIGSDGRRPSPADGVSAAIAALTSATPAGEGLREALAAMILEHDAGGITLATMFEARKALAASPVPMADERSEAVPVPFGYWHQGATEEESDFFLHSESGEVGCVMCVNLYKHPTPYTAPARDGSEPGLTDAEIDKIRFAIPTKAVTQRDHELARAIEAALREKAGGGA